MTGRGHDHGAEQNATSQLFRARNPGVVPPPRNDSEMTHVLAVINAVLYREWSMVHVPVIYSPPHASDSPHRHIHRRLFRRGRRTRGSFLPPTWPCHPLLHLGSDPGTIVGGLPGLDIEGELVGHLFDDGFTFPFDMREAEMVVKDLCHCNERQRTQRSRDSRGFLGEVS